MKICAVIPAYNETKTIAEVVRGVAPQVDIVFVVDDASTDSTAMRAEEVGAVVIRHNRNVGIGASLGSGYARARVCGFDFIVQLDGDGQHNPKFIRDMLKAMRGYDMVIASRFLNSSHKEHPLVRRIGIPFFSFVVSLLGHIKVTDVTSGYRVYRTSALRRLSYMPARHWAVAQTLEAGRKGLKIREISAEMPVRNVGKSQFDFVKYSLYTFRMIWVMLKAMLLRRVE